MLSPPAGHAPPRRAAASLAACCRGIAAIEFALVAPVMISMMIGVYDIAHGMTVQQEVYNATHSILISASSLAVQPDKSTSLTTTQVQQTLSTVFAAIPGRRNGSLPGTASVTLTSVTFVLANPKCTPAPGAPCSYVPVVVWSVAYADPGGRYPSGFNTFKPVTRPCMTLNQTTPTAGVAGDLTSVRTLGVTNPDPMLIVDTHYRYTPMFFRFVTGPIDFWSSGYWPIRSFDPNAPSSARWTRYDIANQNGGVGKCPGYS
ncbi:MAG: TadE/TadG family type IV pilus assembly protein [Janthinobacterium lividum]